MADAEQRKRNKKREKKHAPENKVFEEVNVLVTGFDSRTAHTNNASFLIANLLPPVLAVTPGHPSRVRITVHPTPVPVSYEACADFLKKVTETDANRFHLVLHIGVDPEHRPGYRIERYARSDGYEIEDDGLKKASDVVKPLYWKQYDGHAQTTAHLTDVVQRWRSDNPDDDLNLSEDAGHSICEFLFFASLAQVQSMTKAHELSWKDRATVELLHVPHLDDDENVEKGKKLVLSLIYAIIDSRRARDGDFETVAGDEAPVLADAKAEAKKSYGEAVNEVSVVDDA